MRVHWQRCNGGRLCVSQPGASLSRRQADGPVCTRQRTAIGEMHQEMHFQARLDRARSAGPPRPRVPRRARNAPGPPADARARGDANVGLWNAMAADSAARGAAPGPAPRAARGSAPGAARRAGAGPPDPAPAPRDDQYGYVHHGNASRPNLIVTWAGFGTPDGRAPGANRAMGGAAARGTVPEAGGGTREAGGGTRGTRRLPEALQEVVRGGSRARRTAYVVGYARPLAIEPPTACMARPPGLTPASP